MSATIQRRIEALEADGNGNERPLLLVVRFIMPVEGEADPVGINAAPPHFPQPVDRLPDESWEAFISRLEGMLLHRPGGAVVRVVFRTAGPFSAEFTHKTFHRKSIDPPSDPPFDDGSHGNLVLRSRRASMG